jgi:myo-inositol-1(or 4)-monophosphatase
VTTADLAVETLIRDAIAHAYPNDAMLGEGGGMLGDATGGLWIVDPIDGTTNFMHGLPDWAISIGYAHAGRLTHGVIFAPDHELLAIAGPDHRATMNGAPLNVSTTDTLSRALVVLGYSNSLSVEHHLGQIRKLLEVGAEYRRQGAATIGLLSVATGRVEAYHEARLHLSDAAAGMVIIESAGGHLASAAFAQHLAGPCEVLAMNASLPALAKILAH